MGKLITFLEKQLRPRFPQTPRGERTAGTVMALIVPLVSVFTKAPDRAIVDDAFSCYEIKVSVSARESLGDEQP